LGGLELGPGTYTGTAAIGLTGVLTLNGGTGDAWTFNIRGAFTTADSSKIEFGEGAGTVIWIVSDAIDLGASSIAIGDMQASEAITVGDSATCDSLDSDAAITLGAGAVSGSLTSGGTITLGAGATCGHLVTDGAIVVGDGAEYLSCTGSGCPSSQPSQKPSKSPAPSGVPTFLLGHSF
jgi:hypothetical protein